MKKIILSASLLVFSALADTVSAGDSVTNTVDLTGSVSTTCSTTGAAHSTLNFGDLTDGLDAFLDTTKSKGSALGVITCNYPSSLSIQTTNGILKGSGACDFNSSFANCVKYTAQVSWDGLSAEVIANGDATSPLRKNTSPTPSGPLTASLDLWVSLNGPTDKPLKPGSYTDTLVVQVGAAL